MMRSTKSRTRSRTRLAALLFLALVLPMGQAGAQVAWDSPLMVPPSTPAGWGIFLVDPSPGGGVGVLSTWRTGGWMGIRAGIAEDAQERLAVFGGVDLSGPLLVASDDFPLDLDWVTGIGFGAGDGLVLSAPLGLSIGRELETDDVWFNPYLTPRVTVDAALGTGDSDEDSSDGMTLGFTLDVGLDLSFDPGWAVRFGASVVDRRALAIGFSFLVF